MRKRKSTQGMSVMEGRARKTIGGWAADQDCWEIPRGDQGKLMKIAQDMA